MPALLKSRHRRSKKPQPNPYAERGLERFSIVSAQLQAARDLLAAQLGTPVPLVRFTLASDFQHWIPIIAAPPSASKADVRALRRAASDLVNGGHKVSDAGHNFGQCIVPAASASFSETDGRSDDLTSLIGHNNGLDRGYAHAGKTSATAGLSGGAPSSTAGQSDLKQGDQTSSHLMAAVEGLRWVVNIVAFSLRIAMDIASNAIWSGRRHGSGLSVKSTVSSSSSDIKDKKVMMMNHHPTADMAASSVKPASHANLTSFTQKDGVERTLLALPLNTEAPVMHTQSKDCTLAPPALCSPIRDSRSPAKLLTTSASLPKPAYIHGRGTNEEHNHQAQKKSPNKPVRSSISVKELTGWDPQTLGQAFSWASLGVVLGGLVMGYTPAIVFAVCWWYALPRMREAVGDKPHVRSHHHHHHI